MNYSILISSNDAKVLLSLINSTRTKTNELTELQKYLKRQLESLLSKSLEPTALSMGLEK